MRHNSYCDLCGESYDEDNLATCTQCDREYCYRCGSSGRCKYCAEEEKAGSEQSTPQNDPSAKAQLV